MATSEEGQVIGCHTTEQWNKHFNEGKEAKKLVVIDFIASWCPPCRVIAPVLSEIARKMPNVLFLKVDVDELKEVADEWKVRAMPTFIFLVEGKKVGEIIGERKEELLAAITKHASALSASA